MIFNTLLVAFVSGIILVLVIRKLFPAQLMVRALLIAFVVGGFMIVVIRILFPSLAGGIVAAILAAATIVVLGIFYGKRRSEIDNHRAGDNLYYLGLLFTLVSLAYVLVSLFIIGSNDDLEQRVHMLVGNFGIALSSTVVGILGRIVIQSIGDTPRTFAPLEVGEPVNAPESGRVEVVESVESAVGEAMMLRRQIREATEAFSHFTRVTLNQAEQTKVHTDALLREFSEHIDQLAKHGRAEALLGLSGTSDAWQKAAEGIGTESKKLLGSANQHIKETASQIEHNWSAVAERVESASDVARRSLEEAVEGFLPLIENMSVLNHSAEDMVDRFSKAGKQVQALGDTAAATDASLDLRITALVQAYTTLVEDTKAQQEAGMQAFSDAVDKFKEMTLLQLDGEVKVWQAAAVQTTSAVEHITSVAGLQQTAGERNIKELERVGAEMLGEATRFTEDARRTRTALVDVVQDLTQIVRRS